MTSVIDAVKRLERAGSEDSRSTEKLRAAARTLSDHVLAQLDGELRADLADEGGRKLPREYRTTPVWNGSQHIDVLALWNYDQDRYVPVDENRDMALAFAQNVATGWLDELANYLETRTREAAYLAETLERSAQ